MKTADDAMARVLLVCLKSGYRGGGIFKRMDENRNLWLCLKAAGIFERLPWADVCIGEQDLFFENLLAAIRPAFPNAGGDSYKNYPQPWPGEDYSNNLIRFNVVDSQSATECLERTLQVCDPPVDGALGGLLVRMDVNRMLFQTFHDDPETFSNVAWIGGWLEDNDIFFEDLFSALGGFLRHSERSGSYPRRWPGENYDRYLIMSRLAPEHFKQKIMAAIKGNEKCKFALATSFLAKQSVMSKAALYPCCCESQKMQYTTYSRKKRKNRCSVIFLIWQ